VAFYLPEGEPAVTDAELIADALSGPDWHCDHCDSSNKAMDTSCASCGNLRDDRDIIHDKRLDRLPGESKPSPRETRMERKTFPPVVEIQSGAKDDHVEIEEGSIGATRDRLRKTGNTNGARNIPAKNRIAIFSALFVVCLCATMLILSFTMDFVKQHVITDLDWTRSIGVEHVETLDEAGWSRPSDAYDVETERKIRRYETVTIGYRQEKYTETERYVSGTTTYSCGQTSLGNGYYRTKTCTRPVYSTRPVTRTVSVPITKQEPVWGIWHTYHVDRWREFRRVPASGGDTEPYWPEVELAPGERLGQRVARYSYFIEGEDGQKSGDISFDEWISLDEGDIITIVTNYWGRVKSVSTQ
jgi:hypothetical protein